MKILKLIILISLLPLSSKAQVVFSEFGAGISSWSRIYSTPDETSLLVNPTSENGKINTVILPTLYGKIDLGKSFGFRGRLGYAQNSFTSSVVLGDLVRNEKLVQSIIPVGLSLEFKQPLSKKVDKSEEEDEEAASGATNISKSHFIAGVGVSRYFIQHTFSRDVIGGEGSLGESKFSGNDFGLNVMLGFTNSITENLILTIFTQYNSGSYDHRIYSEEVTGAFEVKNISLQGVEVGFTIGLKLN